LKKSKGAKAIADVARKNGISVAEAIKEIEMAMEAARFNPDPTVRAFWNEYIQSGQKPTAEEFIVYMAERVKADIEPKKAAWLH
jgi:hypothetical protein